jgi:hypothetical protein
MQNTLILREIPRSGDLEETDRLSIDFGKMQQFDEIHSPFPRFRFGNERLRT